MSFELKTFETDGKVYAELRDGKPIYMNAGKEVALDPPGMHQKIIDLGVENKTRREEAAASQTALEAFGDLDPAAARKALETMSNLDDKKLVDAGEVERVKAEVIKAVEDKYKPVVAENETLKASLRTEKITGAFSRSEYLREKVSLPADMIEAIFGGNFSLDETGGMVSKDGNGNAIYSPENPGEAASFDEAIEHLISSHSGRDKMLRGANQNGSQAPGGGNGSGSNGKTMTRGEFDKLAMSDPAAAQKALVSDGMTVVD
jgi:hypothetical protein